MARDVALDDGNRFRCLDSSFASRAFLGHDLNHGDGAAEAHMAMLAIADIRCLSSPVCVIQNINDRLLLRHHVVSRRYRRDGGDRPLKRDAHRVLFQECVD